MTTRQEDRKSGGVTRREFMLAASVITVAAMVGGCSQQRDAPTPLSLAPLPYPENALEPDISADTIGFHYTKHHAGYLKRANQLIRNTDYAGMPLEKIVMASAGKDDQAELFNNAAQAWNHAFYWNSLAPQGGGRPPASLLQKIDASFGSLDVCLKEFAAAAAALFGSGWVWLVEDSGTLIIVNTANADSPLSQGMKPLLTIDVWEHAYYLDYQNRRADYVAAILEKRINWAFAAENLSR